MNYVPEKGNLIDEKLAEHLKGCSGDLKVERKGNGWYMFGRQKIMLSMSKGGNHMLVRVGGGYMALKEYLSKHPNLLLAKKPDSPK